MSQAAAIAQLYHRDLVRLHQEIEAFPDDGSVWQALPGVTNSAGNLALHLEGNLREFIGRQLGGIDYQRERPLEFSSTGLPLADLSRRVEALTRQIPSVVASIPDASLSSMQPEKMSGKQVTTLQYLLHLYGHLSYHLGQIDYLRRIVNAGGAIPLVNLDALD